MKSRPVSFTVIFYLILLLCAGNGSSALAQETVAAPDFAAIDAFVEAQVRGSNLPGLALGIVHGDEIVHLQSFGTADSSGRAITPQTPFLLASVTKSFTALAIMQLVEAGQVELDAPVQQYLPWFQVADPDASARITVRHLLNQTSGFSTNQGLRSLDNPAGAELIAEDYVRGLSSAELTYPVGGEWQYSNANYITLGVIIETVSGESYEQYLQNHILTPLEMHNTFVSQAEAQEHGLATGYQPFFGILRPFEFTFPHADLAAGGIISTAEDMTHYLSMYLNQGRYGDAALISPNGIARLWTTPSYLPDDPQNSYAMGWYAGWQFSIFVRHHWGNAVSFSSYMAVAPEEGWGVVVLVNADHPASVSPAVINVIGPSVLAMLTGQPMPTSGNAAPVIFYGTFVIVTLQLLSLIWGVFRLRRWSHQPESRPQRWGHVALRVVLPVLLNLLAGYVFAIGLPQVLGTTVGLTLRLYPDWGIGLLLSGVIAFCWLVWGIAALVVLRRAIALPAAMPARPVTETIR